MGFEGNTEGHISRRRISIPLILFGILACSLLITVFWHIANRWGPYSKNSMMDCYSGHTIVNEKHLGKRFSIPSPIAPHTQWSIDHQNPVRNWYMVAGGSGRVNWFGHKSFWRGSVRDYVYEIFNLYMPEEEKVSLLHEYHGDLDGLKSKLQEKKLTSNDWDSFRAKWDQKMDLLK